MISIHFDPYFIEEAVFLHIKQMEATGKIEAVRSYNNNRIHIYEDVPKNNQAQAFQDLYWKLFCDFGIQSVFKDTVRGFPLLQSSSLRMFVKTAFLKSQERAELFVDNGTKRVVVSLLVRGALNPDSLRPFLCHELMHISDMVDPEFQYDPNPDLGGVSQVENELIRDRFRILWDLHISARLAQRGRVPLIPFHDLKSEFERSFSHLDEAEKTEVIQNFLERKKMTQARLIQLAQKNRLNKSLGEGGLRCPVCHFTSYENKRIWTKDHNPIVKEIQRDFPSWHPTLGLCSQCFDLYSSRNEALA